MANKLFEENSVLNETLASNSTCKLRLKSSYLRDRDTFVESYFRGVAKLEFLLSLTNKIKIAMNKLNTIKIESNWFFNKFPFCKRIYRNFNFFPRKRYGNFPRGYFRLDFVRRKADDYSVQVVARQWFSGQRRTQRQHSRSKCSFRCHDLNPMFLRFAMC